MEFKFPKVVTDFFGEIGKVICKAEEEGWLIYAIVVIIFIFVLIMLN